ncbi:DUF397 domain-containing protein [Streptomyces lavendulae]|uniref:DUF397 domain-containing protein n=1 Tax=Streptomyces lavendulae TaxID=1914 RepID=UPI0033D143F4
MTREPEFAFALPAACRDPKVNNCPEVATNVPGVVALRVSSEPDTIFTMPAADWETLVAAVRAGEFDLSA